MTLNFGSEILSSVYWEKEIVDFTKIVVSFSASTVHSYDSNENLVVAIVVFNVIVDARRRILSETTRYRSLYGYRVSNVRSVSSWPDSTVEYITTTSHASKIPGLLALTPLETAISTCFFARRRSSVKENLIPTPWLARDWQSLLGFKGKGEPRKLYW